VGENENVTLESPLIVPEITSFDGNLSGPQTFSDAELEVSFDADNIEPNDSMPDEIAFGFAAVAPERWPVGGEGALPEGYTIHGSWATVVWDQVGVDEFNVTATLSEPIPEGREPVWVVADYELGVFDKLWHEDPAEFGADRSTVSTVAGEGLDRTTMWMVASRPETVD
jgi:hypothetical protein